VKQKLRFEQRFLLRALLWGAPAVAAAIALLWVLAVPSWVRWSASATLLICWLAGALLMRRRVVRPLQTISNLLAALRSEDFSIRASGARSGDALGEVYLEINTLSGLLQEQRLGAMEATSLLRMVMEEIDVAVFTFDHEQKLRLINRAGERLLAQPSVRVLERTAGELQLNHCLEGEPSRVVPATFAGATGRWSIRRSTFWQSGQQRQLVVVADVSRALRDEERQAWQRLVRVLGHEINNSLAPIKSISGSLAQLLMKEPPPEDWREDMGNGLGVISSRAEALGRFMSAYTQLAKLPSPRPRPFELGPWLRQVVTLETRLPVFLHEGPALTLSADSDQLEQVLINLLRNAVDSVLSCNGETKAQPQVSVGWERLGRQLEIRVQDSGTGLANTANLFVPFFTTKQGGSGIGLVLSRQIVEAHGGTLTLESRKDANGCLALLRLPID
jgi:two-component system, NtrC family, nitrogen regulation sensor histidine kinase NtrY